MMHKLTLFLLGAILLPLTMIAQVELHPIDQKVNGITLRIDPKLELYNLVAMQFGHNGMTQSNIHYKQEILSRFEHMEGHQASRLLLQSFMNGWLTDDPIFFLLHLDDNLNIQENMPGDILERGGGREHLEEFVRALQDYAHTSGFKEFFEVHQHSFYKQVLAQTSYNFKDFHGVEHMEKYFGKEAEGYYLLLNLIGGYGNFGKSIYGTTGFKNYAVIETQSVSAGLPVFWLSPATTDLILHEFSHGFINPYMDEHVVEFMGFQKLYEPIRETMNGQGYATWDASLYEHLVRAAVVNLTEKIYGQKIGKHLYGRMARGRGFIYVEELSNGNENVEDLLSKLRQLMVVEGKLSQETTSSISPVDIKKPWELGKDSTLFIVGSQETDLAERQRLDQYARSLQRMVAPNALLIPDYEVRDVDLSAYDLVLFGTIKGNSLLQKVIDELPVKIYEDGIMTNRVVKGSNLQLVTSWANPYNISRNMVIYTAQKVEDIRNFEASPVRDQYHYWVGRNTVTLDKGNYIKYWNIWIPEIM